jgi:tRNA uridine 5-carbamoylmethylation protein Kti12
MVKIIMITGIKQSGKTTMAKELCSLIRQECPEDAIGLFSLSQDVRIVAKPIIDKELLPLEEIDVDNDVSQWAFPEERNGKKGWEIIETLQTIGLAMKKYSGSVAALTVKRMEQFIQKICDQYAVDGLDKPCEKGIWVVVDGVRFNDDVAFINKWAETVDIVEKYRSRVLSTGNKSFVDDGRDAQHDTEVDIRNILSTKATDKHSKLNVIRMMRMR